MSQHPNVILRCTLTPLGLAKQTMRAILMSKKTEAYIKIGNYNYHTKVMENDYDDNFQISSYEGDLIFLDFVTYGFSEQIIWDKLVEQKNELELWAKDVCIRHNCTYKINITANFW
jgi:hypothetical protein